MNKIIVKQWEKNKKDFRILLARLIYKGNFIYEYINLLSLIIQYVINKDCDKKDFRDPLIHDPNKITTITLGGYSGDFLFIITPNTNYASVSELWLTKVYYGSCSGCDIMLDAESRRDPKEKLELLMKLSLDIIEEFKPMSDLYPI